MPTIDLYCERLGTGLLAEPVNALTNAAFFLAAWAGWRFARRRGQVSGEVQVLIALTVAIGIGSALFHSYATAWAQFLDVFPILLFQLAFLWIYARREIGLPSGSAALVTGAFLIVALGARQFPHYLNGSLIYAPAIAAIAALGLYHWLSREPRRGILLAAAAIFTVSLCLRTIDEAICPRWPLGTHFLWHLLNSVVLYLCVRTAIEIRDRI